MDPDSPTTKALVSIVTGVEDPSPTLVRHTLAMVDPSTWDDIPAESADVLILPKSPIIVHEPSKNDFVSGAILPPYDDDLDFHLQPISSAPSDSNNSDTATVCRSELPAMLKAMPHKLLNISSLASYDIFVDPTVVSFLPKDFHTTVKGLKRTMDEMFAARPDGDFNDEELFDALIRRGGVPRAVEGGAERAVVYPEDLEPCVGEGLGDLYDAEFWVEMERLAEDDWEDETDGEMEMEMEMELDP